MDHVEHFYETGELLKGTYYFDPALIAPEIEVLHSLFSHIEGSKLILNPLKRIYEDSQTLLWLDVGNNTIRGWQNVVTDEDSEGEYVLEDLQSIKRWCENSTDCIMPYRNGRLFLPELPNTEDAFNQIG